MSGGSLLRHLHKIVSRAGNGAILRMYFYLWWFSKHVFFMLAASLKRHFKDVLPLKSANHQLNILHSGVWVVPACIYINYCSTFEYYHPNNLFTHGKGRQMGIYVPSVSEQYRQQMTTNSLLFYIYFNLFYSLIQSTLALWNTHAGNNINKVVLCDKV